MEAPPTSRAADPAQRVLGSEPEHLNSGQYKAINGCTDSDGQLMSVPLLIESYPETTVYVDSNQQEIIACPSASTSHSTRQCKMLITAEQNDRREVTSPHGAGVYGDSLDFDATFRISDDPASLQICLSWPCSPSNSQYRDEMSLLSSQSVYLRQYIKAGLPYSPPPSSVSTQAEHMSCIDGDPAESTAETENSGDEDGMVDEGEWEYPIPSEDVPLDTMEIIMQRARILLELTAERPYAKQELSEYTCLLRSACSHLSSEGSGHIKDFVMEKRLTTELQQKQQHFQSVSDVFFPSINTGCYQDCI